MASDNAIEGHHVDNNGNQWSEGDGEPEIGNGFSKGQYK